MCNYMGHRVSYADFIRLKQLEKQAKVIEKPEPYRSGFEYKDWPVIRPIGNGDWEVDRMEWGYLPNFVFNQDGADKMRKGYVNPKTGKYVKPRTTLNARGDELFVDAETGNEKMWAKNVITNRCLVLAYNFYEWRHLPVIGKRGKELATKEKFPYYITVENPDYNVMVGDKPHFVMAGLWNRWEDKDTHAIVDTFALATTEANSLMKQIHNMKERMPTILTQDLALEWISEGLSKERITQIAKHQIASKNMRAWLIPKNFSELPEPGEPCTDERVPDLIDIADTFAA